MMQVLQVPEELEQMVALYKERKPKRVLEIGVWHGGTLKEWMLNAADDATVVAVDLNHPMRGIYDRWRKEDTILVQIFGDSQDLQVLMQVDKFGPFDWIFIDADHSYQGVHFDACNYRPLLAPGGALLLHDIVAPDGSDYPPGFAFQMLAARFDTSDTDRFVVDGPSESPHGIGVIYG